MSYYFKIISVFILLAGLSSSVEPEKVIVIDAGHGGKDSGAKTQFVQEKDHTLAIAKKIQTLAKGSDVKVILTREGDDFVSLQNRVNKINDINPDQVISLHLNHSESTAQNGYELYVSNQNKQFEESLALAAQISPHLPQAIGFKKIAQANFFLLRNVDVPATLIDLGYLSNKKDYDFITTEQGQDEMAKSIFSALSK